MESTTAGWHPDPSGQHQARFWDGAQWTDQVRDDGAPAPAPYSDAVPAAPRPKPSGMPTAVFALILLAALIAIAAATLFARAGAAASQLPGPSAEAVVDEFVDHAVSGDDGWRKLTLTTMLTTYDSTASVPFVGTPGVLAALGVTPTVTVTNVEFESAGKPVENERIADRARADLQVTYAFTVDGTKQSQTATVQLWLSRPFTYEGSSEPQAYDRRKTPTGAAPWRVIELTAAGVGTLSTPPADGYQCSNPGDIMVQLSNSARTSATLDVDCPVTAAFVVDGDAAAIAARLPVLGTFSLPDDTMHLQDQTPGSRPLATYVVQTEGAPIAVVMVQTSVGWQLLGITEVAQ